LQQLFITTPEIKKPQINVLKSKRKGIGMIILFLLRIVSMKRNALSHSNPDEHLYGRAGYLYTLMFLRKQLGHNVIDAQLITEVYRMHRIFENKVFLCRYLKQ
jgi:hypothetical protein